MENQHLGLRFATIGIVVGLAVLFVAIFPFNYGIDLRGGYTVTYGLEDPDADEAEVPTTTAGDRVDSTIKVMSKRVNGLGLRDIKFVPEGADRIKAQIPGADQAEADRIKDVLTQLGNLELRLVASQPELERQGVDIEAERRRRQEMERRGEELAAEGAAPPIYGGPQGPAASQFAWYYTADADEDGDGVPTGRGYYVRLGEDQGVVGAEISRVYPTFDERSGYPAVGFSIKAQARGKMAALTGANVGRQLAIILNGRIDSAPSIDAELREGGIITGGAGGFSASEVDDLIATLQSGSLDFKPQLLSEDLIGPTLGEDAIRRGKIAMIIGMIAVVLFMLVYYRTAGLIANLALLFTVVIMLGALLLFGATLTLPGIAGIILTVGMAVDANILIFERIREERDKGKTLIQAVKNGYEQAFRAIFDSNVTTLATAIILVWVGTDVIKGFGVTLAIGILSSMFSALFATKTVFLYLIEKGLLKDVSMMRLIGVPSFPFLRFSGMAAVVSTLLVVGGLAIFFSRGDDKYSIDFTGGGVIQVGLAEPLSIEEMKSKVASIKSPDGSTKYPDAEVVSILVPGQPTGETTRFEISTKIEAGNADELKNDIKSLLEGSLLPEGVPYVERVPASDESVDEALRGGFRFGLVLPASITDEEVRDRMRQVQLDLDSLVIENDASRSAALGSEWTVRRIIGAPTRVDLDGEMIESQVRKAFAGEGGRSVFPEPIPKATTIGKVVAKDLKNKAIIATFLSLVFMIFYIRIRFHEYRYGFAAAICLMHDVIVTLGVCVLFNSLGLVDVKISYAIIAVFLTIVGYSLNDTIVIFDRVRENLSRSSKGDKASFVDTINQSINQTLSRTLLTSVTTLFVVAVLFVVNWRQKSDLEGFAFALLIGIVCGTYSTIYVASPVVVRLGNYLDKRIGGQKQRQPQQQQQPA